MKKDIVLEIAKNSDLIKNFNDVRVFDSCDDNHKIINYGMTDIKNDVLYINSLLDSADVIGLITHEVGHLDIRLESPRGKDNLYMRFVKDNSNLKDVLNFVFDMNIHLRYADNIPMSYRLELRRFLTKVRNDSYEKDNTSFVLSMNYQNTSLQKKVRKIFLNKRLSDIEKVREIDKLLPRDNSGSGGGNRSNLIKVPTEILFDDDEISDNENLSESIKKEIEQMENKINEIRKTLFDSGFNRGDVEDKIKRMSVKDIEYVIKNMDSLKNVFKLSDKTYTKIKEKNKKKNKEFGRLVGYRKFKSFNDLIKNPIDLVLLSDYDINAVRIPTFRDDRKRDSNLIIVRDISGSLSGEPYNSIVRDVVVGSLRLAKRLSYKVCLMDFGSSTIVYKGKDNVELTLDHDKLILDSMANKYGGGTNLDLAIRNVNRVIKENKLENKEVNVILITDGLTNKADKINLKDDKFKLILLSIDKDFNGDFKDWIEKHNSRIEFEIKNLKKDKEKTVIFEKIGSDKIN